MTRNVDAVYSALTVIYKHWLSRPQILNLQMKKKIK